MNVILIIGFSQALILSGLLISKRQKRLPDYFLSSLFFIHGITLFLGYMEIYNRAQGYPYPFFINTSTPLILLHGPALWFYIKSLTAQQFRFKPKYLLHFIPFLIVLSLITAGFYLLPAEVRIEHEATEAFKDELAFPFILGLIFVSTQTYFIWGLLLLRNYRRRIKNYFSEISEMDLQWLKVLLIACIVFYGGISLFYIADYIFRLFSYDFLQTAGYAYVALLILVLGYFGHRQGNIFQAHPVGFELKAETPQHASSGDAKEEAVEDAFVSKLLNHMREARPFLNPELTLARLADGMHVSPDHLSQVLNTKLNRNFFDFVNHYRVEEFKRLCREEQNPNITIMGLAWDAGFNSKATFNRVFKKATGMTPGEFQKAK